MVLAGLQSLIPNVPKPCRIFAMIITTGRHGKKQFWVKWRKHAAREIILQDLNHGGWLHDEIEEKGELDFSVVFALYNGIVHH
jgi:hypothetical protein